MKVAIASDHAGVVLKAEVREWLREHGQDVEDLGPTDTASVDYPDYAAKVAAGVSKGIFERGVLVCGTGIGMSITANKFRGVRAALCANEFMARAARGHNDANVLCLGARVIGVDMGIGIVEAFFGASYAGGRHQRRLEKIAALDRGEK